MKRFLMFLVIAIAVTSLGLSIYYFAKDNEVIFINNTQISVNAGDTFKADDLLTFKNASKYTKVDYSGVRNNKVLTYNKKEGYYAAVKGGETKIVVTTNNRAYSRLVINVIVRDGSEAFPYIIDSEEELRKIGATSIQGRAIDNNKFTTAAHYELGKSIILTDRWTPIVDFTGSINGAGFTISNVNVSPYTTEEIEDTKVDVNGTPTDTAKTTLYTEYNNSLNSLQNAGFISNLTIAETTNEDGFKVAAIGKIMNLNLKNVNINGNFDSVGGIAGKNEGEIRNCSVSTDHYTKYIYVEGKVESEETVYNTIQSTKSGASVAAITGINTTSTKTINGEAKTFAPVLDRVSASEKTRIYVNANQSAGGLAGQNIGGQITESYFAGYAISTTAGLPFGGVAYSNAAGTTESTIMDCYSIVKTLDTAPIGVVGGILYTNAPTGLSEEKEHHIFGVYHSALRTYDETGAYTESDINTFAIGDNTFAKNSSMLSVAFFKLTTSFVTYKQVIGLTDYVRTWDFDNVWTMGENAPLLNRAANAGSVYLIDYSSVKGTNDFSADDGQELYDALATGTGSYNVAADMDLGGFVWNPIESFAGILTGADIDNHQGGTRSPVISNFVIEVKNGNYGMFEELKKDAIISNITFKDVIIRAAGTNVDAAAQYVGTLAGVNYGANITKVTMQNVTVENLNIYGYGGLVGYNDHETNHYISNVTVSGVTFFNSYAQIAGGISAVNNSIISGTAPIGNLPATYVVASGLAMNANQMGGITGINYRTINYAKADMSYVLTIDNTKVFGSKDFIQIGGIAGYNKSTGLIQNVGASSSLALATAKGYSLYVGGTVGYNAGTIYYASTYATTITTNYSYKVYAGGIAGLSSGVIYGCFVDSSVEIAASTTAIEKNNESYVGGLVGGLANASSVQKVGSVSNSIVKATSLKGFYVGGLIGYSYGSVTRCYVDGTAINGFYAGGLAGVINTIITNDAPSKSYDGNNSGLFKYDYAIVSIENVNSDVDTSALGDVDIYNSVARYDRGASAGIAVFVIYGSEVNNCYTVAEFVGEGIKASTTMSRECGNANATTRKEAVAGVIKNTIYTNKQKSIGKEGGRHVSEAALRPAEGTMYKVFVQNNFDTNVWTADIGNLPTIVGLDKLIEDNKVA